jgi:diketogulonate reductase-like aldo/keto reductase
MVRLTYLGSTFADVCWLCALIWAPLTVLAELQQKGLVRHIGVSTIAPAQIAEARRGGFTFDLAGSYRST